VRWLVYGQVERERDFSRSTVHGTREVDRLSQRVLSSFSRCRFFSDLPFAVLERKAIRKQMVRPQLTEATLTWSREMKTGITFMSMPRMNARTGYHR
jgi:hypothetical protein